MRQVAALLGPIPFAFAACRPAAERVNARDDSASRVSQSIDTAAKPDSVIVLSGSSEKDVEGVAFSSDGLMLGTADNGGRVVLWD